MAEELEEILLVERLVFRPQFPKVSFVDPVSAQAHYFVNLVSEEAHNLSRPTAWAMLAPKFDEAIAFKIILVRKKKERSR